MTVDLSGVAVRGCCQVCRLSDVGCCLPVKCLVYRSQFPLSVPTSGAPTLFSQLKYIIIVQVSIKVMRTSQDDVESGTRLYCEFLHGM